MNAAEEQKLSPREESQEIAVQSPDDSYHSSPEEVPETPVADYTEKPETPVADYTEKPDTPVQEPQSNDLSDHDVQEPIHEEQPEALPQTVSVGTNTIDSDKLQELEAQVEALQANMQAKDREIQLLTEQLQQKVQEIEQLRKQPVAPPLRSLRPNLMLKSSSRHVLPKQEEADFWGSLEEESNTGLNDLWIARKNQTTKPDVFASPRTGYKRNPLTKVIAKDTTLTRSRVVNKSLPSKQFRPFQLKK